MSRWKFFVDYQVWNDSKRLFMRVGDGRSERHYVAPLVFVPAVEGAAHDVPTLAESREDVQDGIGDVTGFLQAALDAAWDLGMRPTAYADHTNELKAVRYHLEDMRQLAKLPRPGG